VPEERSGEFLPPEPSGPEPELGDGPPARPHQPPPAYGWQQPYQPPPGYGWQGQPQGPAPPPGWQPPPWGYAPAVREPDNGPAVAGFVLALVGAGLLVLSVGLLAVVSLVLAILGLVYARRGKRKVESGETTRHRGLAQAGFVTSIVTLVIAAPLTLLEIVFLILYASNEEFREDFRDEFDEEFDDESLSLATLLRLGVPILRGIGGLVA
jgi:hypothetical protein